jgi:hypothetical protein
VPPAARPVARAPPAAAARDAGLSGGRRAQGAARGAVAREYAFFLQSQQGDGAGAEALLRCPHARRPEWLQARPPPTARGWRCGAHRQRRAAGAARVTGVARAAQGGARGGPAQPRAARRGPPPPSLLLPLPMSLLYTPSVDNS